VIMVRMVNLSHSGRLLALVPVAKSEARRLIIEFELFWILFTHLSMINSGGFPVV